MLVFTYLDSRKSTTANDSNSRALLLRSSSCDIVWVRSFTVEMCQLYSKMLFLRYKRMFSTHARIYKPYRMDRNSSPRTLPCQILSQKYSLQNFCSVLSFSNNYRRKKWKDGIIPKTPRLVNFRLGFYPLREVELIILFFGLFDQ